MLERYGRLNTYVTKDIVGETFIIIHDTATNQYIALGDDYTVNKMKRGIIDELPIEFLHHIASYYDTFKDIEELSIEFNFDVIDEPFNEDDWSTILHYTGNEVIILKY